MSIVQTSHIDQSAVDSQALVPVTFQLPLVYNDGSRVSRDTIRRELEAIGDRFGGCTVLGKCQGLWEGVWEPSIRVEVSIRAERQKELISMVIALGRRFDQQLVYVDHRAPTVQLLDPWLTESESVI